MTNALISASDSAKRILSKSSWVKNPSVTIAWYCCFNGSKKPLKLISTHGLACCPILPQEMTSVISSMVPGPPGNATYKSASSIIFCFLSCIFETTISDVRFSFANSRATKNSGMMPVTSQFSSIAVSAIIPINPALPPP